MREGWTYKKLGEVCKISIGRTPSRSDMSLWDINKATRNYWVSIADMGTAKDGVIYDTKEYISNKAAKSIPIIPKGTLLLSFKLTLGKTAIAGNDLYTNEAIANLPFISNDVDRDYLVYYFRYFNWEKYSIGDEKVLGKTLNKKKLDILPICYPSFAEQRSIVSRLDAVFAEIDALKANADKQLSEARALFQKALTEAMTPKDGWEKKMLKELTSEIGDGLHGTPKYSDNGNFFFVNGNNLENGIIEIKGNTKRVNLKEYEKYRLYLNSSTLLLSINGTIGKTAFYNGEPIILGKSACYINVLPTLAKEYLRYILLSNVFMEYVKNNSRQATITNLGLKEIRNMPIPLPPLSEQQAIVSRLDALSENVRRYEEIQRKTITECDALKQALLREIFEE
ncbi:MAG: restriction endonuclease subunit S [Paludibacteraceae bacterium]|nr:restriction endonuclease subunit S [Paludibacteraceae bacterium]